MIVACPAPIIFHPSSRIARPARSEREETNKEGEAALDACIASSRAIAFASFLSLSVTSTARIASE